MKVAGEALEVGCLVPEVELHLQQSSKLFHAFTQRQIAHGRHQLEHASHEAHHLDVRQGAGHNAGMNKLDCDIEHVGATVVGHRCAMNLCNAARTYGLVVNAD